MLKSKNLCYLLQFTIYQIKQKISEITGVHVDEINKQPQTSNDILEYVNVSKINSQLLTLSQSISLRMMISQFLPTTIS